MKSDITYNIALKYIYINNHVTNGNVNGTHMFMCVNGTMFIALSLSL